MRSYIVATWICPAMRLLVQMLNKSIYHGTEVLVLSGRWCIGTEYTAPHPLRQKALLSLQGSHILSPKIMFDVTYLTSY
jgi:hypothetical protein